MTKSNDAQRIYPTMRCRDAEAMIRWLKDVLGFTEHVVYRSDGVVQHAQLACGSSLLMLGQARDDEYGKTGRRHRRPPHRRALCRRQTIPTRCAPR